MRLVIARCSVDYTGQLSAHLPMATRLILVKSDGSVSIHADDRAYKPLNWMRSVFLAALWRTFTVVSKRRKTHESSGLLESSHARPRGVSSLRLGAVWRCGALTSALLLLFGCGSDDLDSVAANTVTPESDAVSSIAWAEEGLFVTLSNINQASLAKLDPSSGDLTDVGVPTRVGDCGFIRYGFLQALGNKQLAVVQICPKASYFSRIVTVDPQDGETALLYPESWLRIRLQSFTGGTDGQPLFASQGSRICNSLLEFSRAGVSRPTVEPQELVPGQGESLPEIEAGLEDCSSIGIAETPTVSNLGDLVFASYPEAAGSAGIDRFDAPGAVYLRPRGETQATELIGDVGEVRLEWSPDGRTLALSGSVDGVEGIFLLDVESRELTRISELLGNQLAWSPEGDQLATFVTDNDVRVLIFDVVD